MAELPPPPLDLTKFDESEQVDETIVSHKSSDVQTEKFDQTIGLIEDLIMDEEFRSIQHKFLAKYADEFDPNLDENKFVYTDIHREYLKIIEDFILSKIERIQSDFNLNGFMKQLESRQDEFEGEIFEFLLTFTDFLAFKQWMLEHRQSNIDIGTCLQSISLQSARGTNPTPLVEDPSLSSASLDLGITGTKISKPTNPKKK
jgi:ADP-ribosylation factor-like protein 2-binding protein